MKNVTIIGAGFSGLVSAWRLQKEGYAVTVIERAGQVGGLISTRNHSMGLVETAANGLLASRLVEELFEDCGVKIQTPRKSAKRRFLAVGGRIKRFPLTLTEVFGAALKAIRVRSMPPRAGETLQAWGNRAIGPAVTGKILNTAMLGIYAAEASELSASFIVGRFYDRKLATLKGKLRGTVSASGGMGTLLDRIRVTLLSRGVQFQTSSEADGDVLLAARAHGPVVIAVSAWDAAKILMDATWSSELRARGQRLNEIQSVGLINLTIFFKTKPPRLGFGTLFSQTPPHGESDGILGCLQNSEIFEGRSYEGLHSEAWILGGLRKGAEMSALSDDELLKRVFEKRDRLIQPQSRERAVGHVITRWPRAVPFYSVELERLVPSLVDPVEGIVLFGNYLGDLGLASILERTHDLVKRVNQI